MCRKKHRAVSIFRTNSPHLSVTLSNFHGTVRNRKWRCQRRHEYHSFLPILMSGRTTTNFGFVMIKTHTRTLFVWRKEKCEELVLQNIMVVILVTKKIDFSSFFSILHFIDGKIGRMSIHWKNAIIINLNHNFLSWIENRLKIGYVFQARLWVLRSFSLLVFLHFECKERVCKVDDMTN